MFDLTRGDYPRAFLHANRGRGERPPFPAPSVFQRVIEIQDSDEMRRENANLWGCLAYEGTCRASLRARHGS
jgi:hypothetical protein